MAGSEEDFLGRLSIKKRLVDLVLPLNQMKQISTHFNAFLAPLMCLLHMGQVLSVILTCLLRHRPHMTCPQGRREGRISNSRQMGHSKEERSRVGRGRGYM